MAKYELVDCCPVPVKLVPVLKLILAESGASLQSCYRAADAAALLHRCGKHSQTELYNGFLRHLPGYNPANPPGRSTHELRNDGVAYPGPAGIRLPYWCVGIDVDDAHVQAFIRAAAKHGYHAAVTYPGSRSEYHHVNFRKAPKLPSIWVRRPLKCGDKPGVRVWALKRRLHTLGYLRDNDTKERGFGPVLQTAVKHFQHAHHQHADGIVGAQTWHALAVAVRAHNKRK